MRFRKDEGSSLDGYVLAVPPRKSAAKMLSNRISAQRILSTAVLVVGRLKMMKRGMVKMDVKRPATRSSTRTL